VQNNQTALSTPVAEQSAVRVFADKAAGYGIPGITIDGTQPDDIAAAFGWAAERARAGQGPALIELVAMRICGHAHHDDMLYLGKEPAVSWSYPQLHEGGYANRALFDFWCRRDPIPTYAFKIGVSDEEVEELKREAEALVEEEARAVVDAPWPDPRIAYEGVVHHRGTEDTEEHREPDFDPKGKTFLEAVMLGVGDALRADPQGIGAAELSADLAQGGFLGGFAGFVVTGDENPAPVGIDGLGQEGDFVLGVEAEDEDGGVGGVEEGEAAGFAEGDGAFVAEDAGGEGGGAVGAEGVLHEISCCG
jgi:hypothetical protein